MICRDLVISAMETGDSGITPIDELFHSTTDVLLTLQERQIRQIINYISLQFILGILGLFSVYKTQERFLYLVLIILFYRFRDSNLS